MLKSFLSRLGGALLASRRGATAIEYGLLAALIGVVIVIGAGTLGTTLDTKLSDTATTVANAGS